MSRPIDFWEILIWSMFIVLLIIPLSAVRKADAGSTRVFLDPSSQTVGAVGDFFTVNVNISDVSNLYGYQFKLYYNATVVNGTAQPIEGPFLRSAGGQTFFYVPSFTDSYNSTYGVVWIDNTLTGSVPGVSGDGVLVTLEFKSLAAVTSSSIHLADVVLLDPSVTQISSQTDDGTVAVVPEFSSFLAVLTLVFASSFCVLTWRQAKRKPEISSRGVRPRFLFWTFQYIPRCVSKFFLVLPRN
jgi:hypothetical protein